MIACEFNVEESFVVSQIKVNFSPVLEDEYLTVLKGFMVPASIFMYGSILIAVTLCPRLIRSLPAEAAVMPLPRPLMTPPVTTTYRILLAPHKANDDVIVLICCRKAIYTQD